MEFTPHLTHFLYLQLTVHILLTPFSVARLTGGGVAVSGARSVSRLAAVGGHMSVGRVAVSGVQLAYLSEAFLWLWVK